MFCFVCYICFEEEIVYSDEREKVKKERKRERERERERIGREEEIDR